MKASIDVLRDELFLRLVLELQPHLARPGTRLQVWAQVAEQTNKASKETVFGSREAAKNRLVFLKAVLEDPDHALHSTLSREMRVMLEQIRGEPGCEETTTSRRTRSHRELTTSDEGGAEDTAKASEAKRKRHRLAALDIDQVETPMTRDLVPFVPPPASPRELLDRQLGAQIERDHQSRRERERLQDEVKELRVEANSRVAALERDIALLRESVAHTRPLGTSERQGVTSLQLLEQQRRILEEMKKEQDERREQMAAILEMTKEAIADARGRGRDPTTV